MTQTRTDNGSALGAGSVDNRFLGDEAERIANEQLGQEVERLRARIAELEKSLSFYRENGTMGPADLQARIAELETLIEQQKETILRLHAAAWY